MLIKKSEMKLSAFFNLLNSALSAVKNKPSKNKAYFYIGESNDKEDKTAIYLFNADSISVEFKRVKNPEYISANYTANIITPDSLLSSTKNKNAETSVLRFLTEGTEAVVKKINTFLYKYEVQVSGYIFFISDFPEKSDQSFLYMIEKHSAENAGNKFLINVIQ